MWSSTVDMCWTLLRPFRSFPVSYCIPNKFVFMKKHVYKNCAKPPKMTRICIVCEIVVMNSNNYHRLDCKHKENKIYRLYVSFNERMMEVSVQNTSWLMPWDGFVQNHEVSHRTQSRQFSCRKGSFCVWDVFLKQEFLHQTKPQKQWIVFFLSLLNDLL